MTAIRRLSASSLNTYLRCPQQWKLKYVDRLPEEPKPFLNLGSAVHAALETFYDGRLTKPPPLEEVLTAFEEEFDPDAYQTEEERERRHRNGLEMVRAYYEKHAEDFEPAFDTEKRLSFEVGGVPFTGFVDRLDKVDGDKLRVVDYKTGRAVDLERVRTDRQLTLYQLGVEQMFGMEVASLALYHVNSQTLLEAPRHNEETVEALKNTAQEVARNIQNERFEPDPGHYCQWCDFQPYCPAFADEYPEHWQQEPAPPAPSHEEASALADRYGDLKAHKSQIGSELDEISTQLERFFEETGERVVAGDNYRVKATRSEDWRIDDDQALRDILEPAGLWDQVLKVNCRRKADLPEDSNLPEEIRRACERIAEKRVSWRLYATNLNTSENNWFSGKDVQTTIPSR